MMRGTSLAIVFLFSPVAFGGEKPAKVLLETWDAAFLQGGRAGYVRTVVTEHQKDAMKFHRAAIELRLSVKRFEDQIQLSMDNGDFETPDGKVLGVFLRQYLGKNKQLEIVGLVQGDMLKLMIDNNKPLKPAPWNDQVVGIHRQQRLFKEKNIKPGDEFTYLAFEPSVNLVLSTMVKAKDYEVVELFGGKQKKRLLRVESQPEKIQNVQLPPFVAWLGEDLTPLRSEAEIPGLGRVVFYRSTKEFATNPGPVGSLTDIGISQYVKVKRVIAKPYDTTEALYRITVKDDADPASAFSLDERQQILKSDGKTIELLVKAQGTAKQEENPKVESKFTQSSYFINCDDAKVKELARKAVGFEKDPLKKAKLIERWVHLNMKPASHEAMATADHVARTLTGDCTEFAMLTAAMCRAEEIPSRTAVGLIYADVRQGPVFAFHMWTEVRAGGRWIPLDATLGRGRVGATHIKITESAWEERDLTPILPVVRVLGKVSIDVVRIQGN